MRIAVVIALAAGGVLAPPAASAAEGRPVPFGYMRMDAGGEVLATLPRDLDGDSLQDLAVVARDSRGRRRLLVFYQRRGRGYTRAPDVSLDLGPGAAAVGAAARPGLEGADLIALGPEGVMLFRNLGGRKFAAEAEVARARTLVRAADPDQMAIWSLVLDTNGDGFDEVLVPRRDGYAAVSPYGKGGGAVYPAPTREELLDLEGYLVAARVSFPTLWVADFDGDGKPKPGARIKLPAAGPFDGARKDRRDDGKPGVWTWPLAGGEPSGRYAVPWSGTKGGTVARSGVSLVGDVDGDKRADLVEVTSSWDTREPIVDIATSVTWRLNRRESPFSEKSGGRLAVAGVFLAGSLEDFDGDGRRDLVLVTVAKDIMSSVAALLAQEVTVTFAVYEFREGRLAPDPVLRREFGFPFSFFDKAQMMPAWNFTGDFNGDGVRDLAMVHGSDGTDLYITRRVKGPDGGPRYVVPAVGTFRAPVVPSSILVADLNDDSVSDAVLLFPEISPDRDKVVVILSEVK